MTTRLGKNEIVARLSESEAEFKKSQKRDELAQIALDNDLITEAEAWGEQVEENSEEENSEEEAPKRKSIVPAKYKKQYGKEGSCGDELSDALKEATATKDGTSQEAVVRIGDQNGIDVLGKWGHLNLGQMRMNLGNVLRARLKRGEFVQVDEKRWEAVEEAAENAA